MSIDYNFQTSESGEENQELVKHDSHLDLRYIPEQIRHRDQQMQIIADSTLSQVVNGNKGTDLFIVGPPGTGKTATTKHMIEKTKEHNDQSEFEILYVNCSTYSSGQALFKELLNKVDAEFKPGVELAKNINRFKRKIEERQGKSILIVLDEMQELVRDRRDYLSKPVLYELSRPTEGQGVNDWNGHISIIGISNDPEVLEYVDDDIMSSLEGPKVVDFPNYTVEEIADIVGQRQRNAYIEPVLSGSSVRKIANEVNQNLNSDIRKGIEILKKIPKYSDDKEKLMTDEDEQHSILDEIITELQKDRIRQAFYSGDDDFYIVMSALYNQLKAEKSKLKYVTESYGKACEVAMREKKGDNFAARRSYVYRQLEKLVDADLLEKKKNYKEMSKPNTYEPEFDLEIFREIVEDNLRRRDLLADLKSGSYTVEDLDNGVKEDIENLDKMVSSSS